MSSNGNLIFLKNTIEYKYTNKNNNKTIQTNFRNKKKKKLKLNNSWASLKKKTLINIKKKTIK